MPNHVCPPCKKPSARRGFTLTEIAIVLGIMGVILSAIWVAAGQVSASRKVQQASVQVAQIIAGYRSLWGARGIDTGTQCLQDDQTSIGINAGYFPSNMIVNGAPQSPWGGSVTVNTCQSNNTFTIIYWSLPQAACIALASALYASPDITYQAISPAGGATGTWVTNWLPPKGTGTPWTSSQINTNCGTGNNNVVQVGVLAK